MGMSDMQFKAYVQNLLGRLETVHEQMKEGSDKELKKIMEEMRSQLKKP